MQFADSAGPGSSLFTYKLNGYCSICRRTENFQIRLHGYARSSRVSLFKNGTRALFPRCASHANILRLFPQMSELWPMGKFSPFFLMNRHKLNECCCLLCVCFFFFCFFFFCFFFFFFLFFFFCFVLFWFFFVWFFPLVYDVFSLRNHAYSNTSILRILQ